MRTERDTWRLSSFGMVTGMNTNIYGIVPLMRTLVIRFANYPDWLGPSGKILLGLFVVIQYNPTKWTFCRFVFSFLIFLCLLHVSNPRVRLQEDGYVYSYGMVQHILHAEITITGLYYKYMTRNICP
jgi:hypothetical protein